MARDRSKLATHLKDLAVIAALVASCFGAPPTRATDFTDLWFVPDEPGWGVNVVQSDAFLFVTFFICGDDGRPTWYTASLTWDGTRYAGSLYVTQGTLWATPWNPANHPSAQRVGTGSFEPSAANAYHAVLVYGVDGIGSVVKQLTRQTLTRIAIGGRYLGAQSGAYAACSDSSRNASYTDRYTMDVSQDDSGQGMLSFVYDSGARCTVGGTLRQFGQLYEILDASYQCTGSLVFTARANVYELKATAQGLEDRLSADLPSGCRERANFAGVLQ